MANDDLVVVVRAGKCGNHFNEGCESCHSAARWTNNELDELRAENAKLRADNAALVEGLERIEGQAVCVALPASPEERCDWLINIAVVARALIAQHGEKNDGDFFERPAWMGARCTTKTTCAMYGRCMPIIGQDCGASHERR